MFSLGQIVFSKNGRDKGKPFIVTTVHQDYIFLADGNTRRLEAPKKKKSKHVQATKVIDQEIQNKLVNNKYLLDADIRKALSPFNINR